MRPTALVAVAAPLLFAAGRAVPKFEPDPSWPKPLPNNWMLGQVSGIFVDARDHIWVNRPGSLEKANAPRSGPTKEVCDDSPLDGFPHRCSRGARGRACFVKPAPHA